MREVVASAPGKVNLQLRVGHPGPDGYHPLLTVFEAISLREYVVARTRRQPGIVVDTLVYRPPAHDGAPIFAPDLTRALADLPAEQHLAVRAAKALQPLAAARSAWGATSAGIHLTVHKTIPAAGGMAGGSADAAATLVAVNELWDLGLTGEQLAAVGRTLGADVPACLLGGTSVGVDRGDRLTELPPRGAEHWWSLALCERGLSTPAVFREFDRLGLGAADLPAWAGAADRLQGPAVDLAAEIVNDLAEAALSLRRGLARIGEAARAAGALAWMISGSGPTVAALAADRESAQRICAAWLAGGTESARDPAAPDFEPLGGTAVASGPAPGARVEGAAPVWITRETSSSRAK